MFARIVHAAFAIVPPVELFVVVQAALTALKFSVSIVKVDAEFEVAEEDKATGCPAQTAAGETDAVTPDGSGLIVATTAARTEEHVVVVFLAAA